MPNIVEKLTRETEETELPATAAKVVSIIFNPVSGQSNADSRKREIEETFAAHGYRSEYVITTPDIDTCELVEKALNRKADILAVSGGDGTVIAAMTALIGKGVPLAILPSGTGNLLSLNLGLSADIDRAVETALYGRRRAIDMATITVEAQASHEKKTHHFGILAGVGYDAYIIRDADRESKRRMGLGAYLWAALKNLHHRPMKAHIYIDNARRPIRRRAISVMVANMGQIQGGVEMVPGAQPDDGMLDIAILKAETLRDWTGIVFNALRHRLKDDVAVEYIKARSVEVRLSKPQPMQFDGEVFPTDQRSFRVEVMPKAIEVMVPAE